MKKAVIITAIVTVVSLLCVIGFGIAAVLMGLPVAADQIGRIIQGDRSIIGLNIGDFISEVFDGVDSSVSFVADDSQSKTLDLSGATRVEIRVDAARVEITPVQGNTATIRLDTAGVVRGKRSLRTEVSGNTAVIESRLNGVSVGFTGITHTKLYISLPEKQYEEIMIKLSAGDLSVSNPNCKRLDLKLDAGNTTIKNALADSMILSCDAGNIDVKTATVGTVDIDVDAGNVDLRDVKGKTLNISVDAGNTSLTGNSAFTDAIDAELNMGNIDLKLAEDIGFTLAFEADMGSFLNRFAGKSEMTSFGMNTEDFVSQKGSFEYLDGACAINLKINMGNITIM